MLIFYAAIITIVLVTNCHRFKNESFQFKVPRRKDILVNSDSSLRILDPNKDVPNYSSINEESNVWENILSKENFQILIYFYFMSINWYTFQNWSHLFSMSLSVVKTIIQYFVCLVLFEKQLIQYKLWVEIYLKITIYLF